MGETLPVRDKRLARREERLGDGQTVDESDSFIVCMTLYVARVWENMLLVVVISCDRRASMYQTQHPGHRRVPMNPVRTRGRNQAD